jgi:hypothetical protein
MLLEKLAVRVAEMQMLSSEPLEFPMRHEDSDRLPSASQFNLAAGFGLVNDSG